MTNGGTLQLNLESTLDSVEAAELIVQQLAGRRGFSEQEVEQFMIAIRETMANAISHGNGYSREKSVYFGVVADSKQFKVTVRDQGLGFDPEEVPDPTAEDNLLRTSGRGLLLMRSFVDELSIRRGDPAGTEVVLVKYSPEPTSHKEEDVSLATNIREVDGVSIVDLSGRITLGEGSGQLRDTVRELLGKGQKKIVLNLGDVSYIDSSGLGELVSSYTTAANQGAKVKLLNVQKKVSDLLQITKLYTVFDDFGDEASAVMSFS
jgi:anti-sigma B factor antagonist